MALQVSKPAVSSIFSTVLDLPPSCIQFCPAHPKYFVVGTYNLQKDEEPDMAASEDGAEVVKKPQSRNGSLLVFTLVGSRPRLLQTLQQPSAILDLRFHPDPKKQDVLAVVSSTGTLAVFQLNPNDSPEAPLCHLATSRCQDLGEDVLFLQCNWHPENASLIGVTTSTGLARLLELDDAWRIRQAADLNITNTLEAWAIAFAPSSSKANEAESHNTAYCGGDDSVLRYSSVGWDGKDNENPCQEPYSAVSVKRRHEAGVTAILPLPCQSRDGSRLVVTGSYDDHIRIFLIQDLDLSYGMSVARLLLEENLGGGVWRLDLIDIASPEPEVTDIRILVSCMHAGARVVSLHWHETAEGESMSLRVLGRFEEHQSMNYGSDFVRPLVNGEANLRCVSTSFYDRLLCVWDCEL